MKKETNDIRVVKLNPKKIFLKEGKLPTRPLSLSRPELIRARSNTEAVEELLISGKVAALGGLSLIGSGGVIVRVVTLLQAKDKFANGWTFQTSTKKPLVTYIDTSIAPPKIYPFPNTMVYFVGEADSELIGLDAKKETLEEVVSFIIPFINDGGPPKGIDW
jgi:hypothetical protein